MNQAELAEAVLAMSGDGIVAFDRELRCTFWNPAMEHMFGTSACDAVGRRASELLHFHLVDSDHGLFRQILDGQDVILRECPYPPAGRSRPGTYDATYSAWRSQDGTVIGGIGLMRDTTKRHEAEQQVREIETRFQNMADVAPVLLWMADTTSLCTFFNQTWLDFTGNTLEQEWGVGWAEGVHFEDFQRCVDTYMAAFASRRVFAMEYRLRRADGEYRWVIDRGTPRYSPSGQFAGYIGSCVDITDRKELETQLLRAVRVRDEFLSIVSHELRTPVTVLRLQVDSMGRSLERRAMEHLTSGRLAETNAEALAQVGRLTTLIERLLDISRFGEGRLVLDRQEIDLVAMVRAAIETMQPSADLAGCELTLTAPPTLWGNWDPVRLEQVLTNLLANAMKFGAQRPIGVTLSEDDTFARLVVEDHGIGIEPQHRKRIFERFERGVSALNFGGLGLGLWVAKQIVDAHQGTIQVDSAPGEGAKFVVALPRRAVPPRPKDA
jgi:PAS domain S-box-containing protein